EERKDERNRRQRLLPAREQMDAAVLLAGRLRHDLHPGVEDLLPRHDQFRFAAAEERREERAEMAVHALECLAQELARLAVDAADRVLQGLDRLLEVARLGIEEALPLAARAQLLDRRQVHRAELVDTLREARD